ncbi:MAG: hypothetical protein ACRDZO_27970, partial [Egibacteraceae bacterium]
HLPAGGGEATLHPVDLTVGWELAHLAVDVREWRKRKNIIGARVVLAPEDFAASCAAAISVSDLRAAYGRAVAAGEWNDLLRARFTRRRLEIEAAK